MNSRYFLVAFIVSLSWSASGSAAPRATSSDEAELRKATQQLLDAVGTGNAAVWDGYLHGDFKHVDESGEVRTRAQLLNELAPLPPGLIGSITIATFQLERFGSAAIAIHEDHESLSYHGQQLETRYRTTDTWLSTRAGWKLIAEHTTVLLQDPPAMTLSAQQLCAYNGTYTLTAGIAVQIECSDGALRAMRAGREPVVYLAELPDLFFAAGSPRTRRIFLRDGQGIITGFADRREGNDIRWTKVR